MNSQFLEDSAYLQLLHSTEQLRFTGLIYWRLITISKLDSSSLVNKPQHFLIIKIYENLLGRVIRVMETKE